MPDHSLSAKLGAGEALPATESLAYRDLCEGCQFGGARMLGRGDFSSPWVIVGESPGYNELREGVPFVGQSGVLLEKRARELLSGAWYITNAISCGYQRKQGDKRKDELPNIVRCCRSRLLGELEAHPRQLILALGNGALWGVTGNYNLKITQCRGKLITDTPLASIGILPILHPAAILRGTGNFRQFNEDLEYAQSIKRSPAQVRSAVEPEASQIIVHNTPASVYEAIQSELLGAEYLGADIETDGFNPRSNRVLLLGLSASPERVHIFPEQLLYNSRVLQELFDPHGVKRPKFIWHNGKFDTRFLRTSGVDLSAHVDEDTMLLSYALDENPGVHDLEQVASDVLGADDYKYVLKQWVRKKTDSYRLVPFDTLSHYAAQDISRTLQIFWKLRARVASDRQLDKLYSRTLLPASELLRSVETRGFHIDLDQVRRVGLSTIAEINSAYNELVSINGDVHFNPNSPSQVASIIYDKLRIPAHRGNRGTGKDILVHLPSHPFLRALSRHRKASKLFSTYVVGVLNQVENDGCVHSTYLLHGTRTGRLSSRNPNMQNIPRDKAVRGMFDARPLFTLLEADLNQAELRSLAECSGDEYLVDLFNSDSRSLHDEMNEFLFGSRESHASQLEWDEHRMRAKAVNFGIPYGRDEFSIAEEFNVPNKTARAWIEAWFNKAPGAKRFIDQCRDAPARRQTISTPFGYKKRHGLVTRENLKAAQNEASNFPHQSIASSINLHAAIALQPVIENVTWGTGGIVNLVHDSVISEVPNDPRVINTIKEAAHDIFPNVARQWGLNKVPFIVDAKLGTRWGSGKEIK